MGTPTMRQLSRWVVDAGYGTGSRHRGMFTVQWLTNADIYAGSLLMAHWPVKCWSFRQLLTSDQRQLAALRRDRTPRTRADSSWWVTSGLWTWRGPGPSEWVEHQRRMSVSGARVRHARGRHNQQAMRENVITTTHRNETLCRDRLPVARPSPNLELKNNDSLLTLHSFKQYNTEQVHRERPGLIDASDSKEPQFYVQ